MKQLFVIASLILLLPLGVSAALSSENFVIKGQSVGAPNTTLVGDSENFGTQYESGSLYILPASAPVLTSSQGGTKVKEITDDTVVKKTDSITLCHSSGNSRYVAISNAQVLVALSGAEVEASLKGHAGHDRDIIPAFRYNFGEGIKQFSGQNWTEENIKIYENNCAPEIENVPPADRPVPKTPQVPGRSVDEPKGQAIVCGGKVPNGNPKVIVRVLFGSGCSEDADTKVSLTDSPILKDLSPYLNFRDAIPDFPSTASLFVSPITVLATDADGVPLGAFEGPVVIEITDERVLGITKDQLLITQPSGDETSWERLSFEVSGDVIRITINRPGEVLVWFVPAVAEAATTTPVASVDTPLELAVTSDIAWPFIYIGLITGLLQSLYQLAAIPFSVTHFNRALLEAWHNLIALLTFKKRRLPWGTVYDSKTKAPLDPAYVELFSESGEKVAEAITDLDGRYGFLVPEGKYSMLVRKTNYIFPSRLSTLTGQDVIYHDLYFGGPTTISSVVTHDIPMDPVNFDWNQHEKLRTGQTRFFNLLDPVIIRFLDLSFFVGFLFMVWQSLAHLGIESFLLMVFYSVLLIYRLIGTRPILYGYVTQNDKPMPYAIINIFQADRKILSKVTDAYGRYIALLPEGSYIVRIEEQYEEGSYRQVFEGHSIAKKGILNSKIRI